MGTWSRSRSASAFTSLRPASPQTRRCVRPTGPCTQPNGAPGSLLSVPEPLLSTADWFASLSTVYLSASMLITDQDDRILLVKPNYRPDWGIPGGIVEADEAPDQCATREIAEELGLGIPAGDLLVVDWVAAAQDRPQAIMNFIFDGGVLADPGAIRLQEEELDDAQFLGWAEAEARMAPALAARVPAPRPARQSSAPVSMQSQRYPGERHPG